METGTGGGCRRDTSPGTRKGLLDHRGLVLNFPLGALAHLGLARAYALSGDSAESRTAYQDFLTLWKDADPDIPILKEAKGDYAKLASSERLNKKSGAPARMHRPSRCYTLTAKRRFCDIPLR